MQIQDANSRFNRLTKQLDQLDREIMENDAKIASIKRHRDENQIAIEKTQDRMKSLRETCFAVLSKEKTTSCLRDVTGRGKRLNISNLSCNVQCDNKSQPQLGSRHLRSSTKYPNGGFTISRALATVMWWFLFRLRRGSPAGRPRKWDLFHYCNWKQFTCTRVLRSRGW